MSTNWISPRLASLRARFAEFFAVEALNSDDRWHPDTDSRRLRQELDAMRLHFEGQSGR